MTRLTDEALAELERLDREGTARPWEVVERKMTLSDLGREHGKREEWAPTERGIQTAWVHGQLKAKAPIVSQSIGPFHEPKTALYIEPHNAALLVAAANALPDLLREVRRLRAVEAAARGVVATSADSAGEWPEFEALAELVNP